MKTYFYLNDNQVAKAVDNISFSIYPGGTVTLMMATYIIIESGLSFIGFGIPQPTPTWGNMISEAQNIRILRNHPEAWIPPGVAILVTVLAINFIGDGLRDALDPKSKSRY